jgi:death-on-curing protein
LPSGKRHYRITLADALSAHDRALKLGGRHGIPNIGLVEAAIGRPYVGYDRSIQRKAAALVQSVASNHGFADGNKRTATILMVTLLNKSGYDLKAIQGDGNIQAAVEKMVLDVVNHRLDLENLVRWFRARIRRQK